MIQKDLPTTPSSTTVDHRTPRASGSHQTKASFLTRYQTLINFWLDFGLLINFLTLVWVAVIVQFVFPPAGAAVGYSLWGLELA